MRGVVSARLRDGVEYILVDEEYYWVIVKEGWGNGGRIWKEGIREWYIESVMNVMNEYYWISWKNDIKQWQTIS